MTVAVFDAISIAAAVVPSPPPPPPACGRAAYLLAEIAGTSLRDHVELVDERLVGEGPASDRVALAVLGAGDVA